MVPETVPELLALLGSVIKGVLLAKGEEESAKAFFAKLVEAGVPSLLLVLFFRGEVTLTHRDGKVTEKLDYSQYKNHCQCTGLTGFVGRRS